MLFFVRHKDREYHVRVESKEQKLKVRFEGGEEEPLDIYFYGNDCTFIDDHNVFSANVVGTKTDYTVWRPGGNIQLTVESEYRRIVGLLRGQEVSQSNNVYAKMPGKIVKVMAKVGQAVGKGDSVFVMEAMKMENEIRTTCTGKITNVCVKEGQAVETGTLLLEIETEDE